MVSRRNYIAIVMMLLILFVMFQFSGVMKKQLNEYGENSYAENADTNFTREDAFCPEAGTSADIVYVGNKEGSIGKVVTEFCTYSKKTLRCRQSMAACRIQDDSTATVIIDGRNIVKSQAEVKVLNRLVKEGADVIFASMPDYEVVTSNGILNDMMGIYQNFAPEVKLDGMHLFSGFLMGGEAVYQVRDREDKKRQDLDIEIPWYVTGSGTETYMVGTIPEKTYRNALKMGIAQKFTSVGTDETSTKNTLMPAVIWRNSWNDRQIFCINADFMLDSSGIGILSAIMAEMSDYSLYPVVNAQNFVIANFPAFASENSEGLKENYSQPAEDIYQDIIWPSLSSLAEKTGDLLTCMLTPQFSYSDALEPNPDTAAYYLKLLKEEEAEAGLSATSVEGLPVSEKMAADDMFWDKTAPGYQFRSLYIDGREELEEAGKAGKTRGVRTVVLEEEAEDDPIVGYGEDGMLLQYSTSDGIHHTFQDDFKLRCQETALGYSNIVLNLYHVTYPGNKSDLWQNLGKVVAANAVTYWEPFDSFASTTLSTSDQRIRRFLALDYEEKRNGDSISLTTYHFEEQAYFVLKLHDEKIKSLQGGSYKKLGDGFYLITVKQPEALIRVESTGRW